GMRLYHILAVYTNTTTNPALCLIVRRTSVSDSLFFKTPSPSANNTLSLHDALPILRSKQLTTSAVHAFRRATRADGADKSGLTRSEEHTSELQSRSDLVCRLLLEKKKYLRN